MDAGIGFADLIEKDGEAFFEWLEAGAAIYVCGDATRMAPDVDQAIRDVIAAHSDRDPAEYMSQLAKEGRYQRDIY